MMIVKKFSDKDIYKLFLKNKVGIRCNTEKKCHALIKFIIDFIVEDRQITDLDMECYKEDTCIDCSSRHGWTYCDSDYYSRKNIPLVEFDDVLEVE